MNLDATTSRESLVETGPLRIVRGLGADEFCVYSDGKVARVALGVRERITLRGDHVSIEGPRAHEERARPSWEQVASAFERLAGDVAYGYLAFDLARLVHPYPHSIEVPLHFIVPEIHCVLRADGIEVSPREARGRVEAALARPAPSVVGAPLVIDVQEGSAAYKHRLARALARVQAHDLDKVIVTRTVSRPAMLDVLATYERALANQAARRFAFQLGSVRGVGSCPEVVLVARGRDIHTTVLAGTKPRGATPGEDDRLRRALMHDAKEVREHAMSVRMVQEEMRRVSTPEDFAIRDFMEIKPYPFTHHISSRICGRLAEGKSVWDAVREIFPGVTCTGVPKSAAIPLIGEIEETARGIYGGCVGFYERGTALDLGIALRSAFEYSGLLTISAGAGVVAESALDAEVEESVNKMRTIAKYLVEKS